MTVVFEKDITKHSVTKKVWSSNLKLGSTSMIFKMVDIKMDFLAGQVNNELDEGFFQVEEVVGREIINGESYYWIKWLGYPESDNTLEPLENLENIMHMVEEFDMRLAAFENWENEMVNRPSSADSGSTQDDQLSQGQDETAELPEPIVDSEENEGERPVSR